MTEIKNDMEIGQIQIADDVIAVIAGTAAMEINGIAGMGGHLTEDIVELLGRKNLSKGVKVSTEEKYVTIELNLLVKFGCKIQDVSLEVQEKVKHALETMTGLICMNVNIYVSGIVVGKEKAKNKDKNNNNNNNNNNNPKRNDNEFLEER